jgi:hypothetical protein
VVVEVCGTSPALQREPSTPVRPAGLHKLLNPEGSSHLSSQARNKTASAPLIPALPQSPQIAGKAMLSSTPAVALLVLSAITLTGYDSAAAETIPCESVLPGHKMTASPTKKYTFVDGRSILGKTYDVGGCGPTAGYLTGTAYQTNYTFMSYNSPVTSPACLVKKSGDKGIYDSFQAVVMEAHGFQWTPKFSVDDIDALPTTAKYQGEVDTWRESALAFGVSKGKVAYPSLAFSSGTMLKQKTYTITAAALAEMGLGALGELDVVGSEFNEDKPFYNCPFSDAATSSRCRMTVAFAEPIDKLVILYGAAHKVRFSAASSLAHGCESWSLTGRTF